MAVMQRLKCSADCGAPEFDAMAERRAVGKGRGGERGTNGREKLVIIDKTPDGDGFPRNSEVDAICVQCGAALEVRMMTFAIGGEARGVVEDRDPGRSLRIEFGQVARRLGERIVLHDCDGGNHGERVMATIRGPLVTTATDGDGPKLVEIGGVAVKDDGGVVPFRVGCQHGSSPGVGSGRPN